MLISSTSPEDPKRGDIVRSLEELKMTCLKDFGITHTILEARSGNPETICLPPFSHLTASLIGKNSMESPSMMMEDCLQHLEAVDSMNCITNRKDIDEAIKYVRLLLASLQQSPVHLVPITTLIILRSCKFLQHAFILTSNPEYLDQSIDVRRKIFKTSHAQWTQNLVIDPLIWSLFSQFRLSRDRKDLDEIIQLFPIVANNTYVKVSG